ncbi:hypothetical protein CTAM01_17122, partial [Colletotrichum tamarilloi]
RTTPPPGSHSVHSRCSPVFTRLRFASVALTTRPGRPLLLVAEGCPSSINPAQVGNKFSRKQQWRTIAEPNGVGTHAENNGGRLLDTIGARMVLK